MPVQDDLRVKTLGECLIRSPMGLSTKVGDDLVNYLEEDFTEDGIPEHVFTIEETNVNERYSFASYMVFHCKQGVYSAYSFTSKVGHVGRIYFNFFISPQKSITMTGKMDLLVQNYSGTSYCEHDVQVISWINGEWHDFYVDWIGCPGQVSLMDMDNDGLREILLLGALGTSPVDEIHRGYLRTYKFSTDQKSFVMSAIEVMPSDVRIHILDDAETALDHADYIRALELFERAATDDDLVDFPAGIGIAGMSPETLGLSSMYQQAFSRFRLVTIWLRLGFDDRAKEEIVELIDIFPSNKPAGEFTDLALLLFEFYEQTGEISDACRKVGEYSLANFPTLAGKRGDPGKMLNYEHDELCPF